jgi:hypothetical protein
MTDFDKIIDFTLDHESGTLVTDAGGLTRWGISSKYNPEVDVANLTRDGAAAVYQAKYWDGFACSRFAWPLDAAYFECCVNPGVAYANEWAVACSGDVLRFLLLRAQHYRERAESTPSLAADFHGWIDRVLDFFVRFAT